jgi:hypothetical protein
MVDSDDDDEFASKAGLGWIGGTLRPGPKIVKVLALVIEELPNFRSGSGGTITSKVEE